MYPRSELPSVFVDSPRAFKKMWKFPAAKDQWRYMVWFYLNRYLYNLQNERLERILDEEECTSYEGEILRYQDKIKIIDIIYAKYQNDSKRCYRETGITHEDLQMEKQRLLLDIKQFQDGREQIRKLRKQTELQIMFACLVLERVKNG